MREKIFIVDDNEVSRKLVGVSSKKRGMRFMPLPAPPKRWQPFQRSCRTW